MTDRAAMLLCGCDDNDDDDDDGGGGESEAWCIVNGKRKMPADPNKQCGLTFVSYK